jgi:hypothetical protein
MFKKSSKLLGFPHKAACQFWGWVGQVETGTPLLESLCCIKVGDVIVRIKKRGDQTKPAENGKSGWGNLGHLFLLSDTDSIGGRALWLPCLKAV